MKSLSSGTFQCMPSTSINTLLPPPHTSDRRQSTLIHPCRSHFQRSRMNGGRHSYSTKLRRDPTGLCFYHAAQALTWRRTVLNILTLADLVAVCEYSASQPEIWHDKVITFFFFLSVWKSNTVYIQDRSFSNKEGIINIYSDVENSRKFGSSAMLWPYLNIPGTTLQSVK